MDITAVLIFLAIGAVAGWLAGLVTQGAGFGLLVTIVVGIVGAAIGGWYRERGPSPGRPVQT